MTNVGIIVVVITDVHLGFDTCTARWLDEKAIDTHRVALISSISLIISNTDLMILAI